MKVEARLSDLEINLKYSDYVGILLVHRDNVGKKVDKEKWDNLEAIFWQETTVPDMESPRYSKEVSYSTSARHVRYGKPKSSAEQTTKVSKLDFFLECGRVDLLLRRDDALISSQGKHEGYDFILFAIRRLTCSAIQRLDSTRSVTVSLGELSLIDLGDSHRRSKSDIPDVGDPLYSVVAEGYHATDHKDDFDSQVVFTIDKPEADSKVTNATVVVNYLSLAALFRPLEELYAFLCCKWPMGEGGDSLFGETDSLDGRVSGSFEDGKSSTSSARTTSATTRLKLVLHYPRLILVADENDRNSRALVLEG